jgi:hypothetical protein
VLDATTVKTEGASNTYISVNTSNQIYGYVGGTQKFSLDASNSKFGYDNTQTYFGASVGSTTIVLAGSTKFIGTTTYVLLGNNVSLYPRIYGDATNLYLYGTATTYFSATSSNQLYAYAAGSQAIAIDGAQTTLKFGSNYTFTLSNTLALLQDNVSGNYRFYTSTPGFTVVGHNFATTPITPAFVGLTTYARLQGILNTYIQCHDISHATAPNEIWANVLDTTTKRSIQLKAGDYRFGYYVDNNNGVYYKATSTTTSLMHTNNTLLTYSTDTGLLVLGYGGLLAPYVSINATYVTLSVSPLSFFISASACELWRTGSVRSLYVTSTESTLLLTDTTYVKVASNRIDLRPGTLNGTHTNAYAYVGRTTAGTNIGVGYIKVPYVTVDQPPSASDYPQGALIVCNDATGLISRLFYKTFDGWKFVGIGSAP